MNFLRRAAMAALSLTIMLGCIIYSKNVSTAVTDAIRRCVFVIIPSLFAFMAVSKLLVMTGLSELIFMPFDTVLRFILKLPKGGAAVFMISNIAGYPVGCSMLKEMVLQGRMDRRSAEVMSIYCYGAGPAFIINIIGIGIFGASRIGLSIFLSAISTNILLAAVVNRIYRPYIGTSNMDRDQYSFSEALVSSVTSAGNDLLKMSAVILFFSAVLSITEASGALSLITGITGMSKNEAIVFKSVLEVTNLGALNRSAFRMLPYISAVCGFGGLCVVLQLKTVIGRSFSLSLFFKWMPIKMVLNFWSMKLFMHLTLDNSVPTFVKNDDIIVRIDNFIPSICLIMMIFILLFQKRLDFLKRV